MFWYHGQLNHGSMVSLPVTEPGLLFGATVFTTLRIYQQSLDHPLTAWQSHCDRLQSSIHSFGWGSPDWSQIRAGAEHLLAHYPVLRITIFPDGMDLITGRSLPADLDQVQQTGITAWLANDNQFCRSIPHHKTGNYLPSWLALQAAQAKGAQEAILTEPSTGNWLETSTGNLWGWADGCWWTPPVASASPLGNSTGTSIYRLDDKTSLTDNLPILPGIARSQLISWLKCQNKKIREQTFTPQRVATFETLAYCNSIRQVVPIHTVLTASQSMHYDASHPSLCQLLERYRQS